MFKINNSKVGFGGTKLCLGKFLCTLEKLGAKKSEDQGSGRAGHDLAILEFTVKEILSKQAAVSEKQPDGKTLLIKENQVGQRIGWSWDMTKAASGGNLISLCAAYIGVENPQDAGQIQEAADAGADWEKILNELMGVDETGKPAWKNPGLGHEFIIETKVKTQKGGFFFVVYDFYPVGAKTAAA